MKYKHHKTPKNMIIIYNIMQYSCICTQEPLHNEIVCNEIYFTVYREIDVTSYYTVCLVM